jgi:hypothetical protein
MVVFHCFPWFNSLDTQLTSFTVPQRKHKLMPCCWIECSGNLPYRHRRHCLWVVMTGLPGYWQGVPKVPTKSSQHSGIAETCLPLLSYGLRANHESKWPLTHVTHDSSAVGITSIYWLYVLLQWTKWVFQWDLWLNLGGRGAISSRFHQLSKNRDRQVLRKSWSAGCNLLLNSVSVSHGALISFIVLMPFLLLWQMFYTFQPFQKQETSLIGSKCFVVFYRFSVVAVPSKWTNKAPSVGSVCTAPTGSSTKFVAQSW